jgi:hypothetical protein
MSMSTSLGEYHHAEDAPPKGSRIVAWVVIALIAGGIAFYVVDSGMLTQSATQTGQSFPRGL